MGVMKFGIGARASRKEDMRLLTGQGRFTADEAAEGTLHAVLVRSPYASASFTILSTETAAAMPGVRLVLTAANIAGFGDMPCMARVKQPDGSVHDVRNQPVLCRDRVRYAGEAVAMVVADTAAQAEDAAETLEIDWQPDDAVLIDPATALDADAVLVWPERGSNLAFTEVTGDRMSVEAAFAKAAHVTRARLVNNRLIAHYMEPRAALGQYDPKRDEFTLHCGTQGVHSIRKIVAEKVMGMPRDKLVVLTGDVGGGFGTKGFAYREYPLVLEAAKRLGAPVKWVSTRTEHALVDTHGRDSIAEAEMALDADGRVTALKIVLTANLGAYTSQYGPMIPTMARMMATGVYDIPAFFMEIRAVYTHTTPVDAYRGAGRPEAAYIIERMMEQAARETGRPVDAIRAMNFIRPDQFPYSTPGGRIYDVGEFEAHMREAMQRGDWDGFEARRQAALAEGRWLGRGMATYVEACAFEGSEPAKLTLEDDGTFTLDIGTQTNGQGHATAYSQFVADVIGVDFDRIRVVQGDSRRLSDGGGTGGSRSIPLGGVSVRAASVVMAERMKQAAADELEAGPDDIELIDGRAVIAGTDRSIDFAAVAKAFRRAEDRIAISDVEQDEATYPNGTHLVEASIDPETGVVSIERYLIVDDFGVTVNPMLLLGQIHGGVAQGVGQALLEGVGVSPEGQPLTATLMDYALPRADMMGEFAFHTRHVPSKTNALGIKGAGEAATIGATPAVMNAVVDALWRATGSDRLDMPATPSRVWEAIVSARGS